MYVNKRPSDSGSITFVKIVGIGLVITITWVRDQHRCGDLRPITPVDNLRENELLASEVCDTKVRAWRLAIF